MHLLASVNTWLNNWIPNERGIGPYQDMDTISMLLTGWVIFIVISVGLVKYLYFRFVKKTGFPDFESEALAPTKEDDTQKGENASTTRVVETISGVKSVSSKKPQAPVRRRRIDKSAGGCLSVEGYDDVAAFKSEGPCTGPDPKVVDFINKTYDWIFTEHANQKRPWEDVKEVFMNAVNKTLRDEDLKNDLAIAVVDFKLNKGIRLSNIFAECIHPNNVKVTSDCELQVNGEITVSAKDSGIKRYQFFVDRLCGRSSTLLDCEEKTAIAKMDGWPEICVGISSNSPSKGDLDPNFTESIGDRMTSAIRNSVVEIDFSKSEDFPVAQKFTPKKHTHGKAGAKKYLLIKIVRGKDLGVQKGCQEPYCAVELDDPPQKFQTDPVRSQNPVWNENFVFNASPIGGELLFEVYDRVGTRFLGCNIISIDELGNNKSMNLPLKSRRMEISDQISGSLEAQFTFLGEKEFLQRSKEMAGKLSVNGNLLKTARSVFTRPPDSKSSTFAEHVIKELERNSLPNANKSTLIIHAVQRDISPNCRSRPVLKIEKLSDGSYNEVYEEHSLPRKDKLKQDEVATGIEGQYGDERGRRRTRKGDIFTSIRRRFSKGRSQSAISGGGGAENGTTEENDILPRSVSADRQSVGSGRLGLASTRSSTSELSGISGFSTSTFVHENSTLVIECVENRVQKYYLVPPNLAETGKWKKKGKKLHIYNDHTFIAKHLPNGTMCELCTLRLPFSLGKQGYQCRDCKMRCHKECHVRAPSFCPKTSIYDIELSKAERVETASVFNSLFGGKRDGVGVVNNALNTDDSVLEGKAKKKKRSIFRKLTKLGKISEENLESKEKLNSEVVSPPEGNELADTAEGPKDEIETPAAASASEDAHVEEPLDENQKVVEAETHAFSDESQTVTDSQIEVEPGPQIKPNFTWRSLFSRS